MNAVPAPAIRLARADDAEAIACLSRDTIEAGLPWRWRAPAIRDLVASARHNVIVAERDGAIAGFAAMSYADTEAYLALLAVAPAARRTGLARHLLGWLLTTADVAGTAVLRVDLREDNLAARRLYMDAGFVECGRKPGGYYGRVDQVSMRLTLRPAEAAV
ncbi:MAG: GNAT family N-acetyltransferase [Burkholderiales bacterium]|nr:GNAT family N-acetyltransferase [Burkholderiales bacterium]